LTCAFPPTRPIHFFIPKARLASLLLTCLNAFGRSTLGIDLNVWLACRVFSLTDPFALTCSTLYAPHGPFPEKAADNVTVQVFRKECPRELKKAALA